MKLQVNKKMFVVLFMVFLYVVNLFGADTVQGFTGIFAPNNWQSGSNSPAGVNLVDTSAAPNSVKLSNYAPWAISGATFVFPKAPSDGTVSFSFKITGGTVNCPGSYSINKKVVILSNTDNSATFSVTAGDSFGFALNGKNLPDDFGCKCNGSSVTFVITNFVFTAKPSQGFAGFFAPGNWESGSNSPAGVNLVDTSAAPNSVKLSNYAPWAISGATFVFPKAPSNGTVSFSFKITGGTTDCPGSYSINKKVVILSNTDNSATFTVAEGDSFGFALNGKNLPDDFGCKCNGNSVSFIISNFVFTSKLSPIKIDTVNVDTHPAIPALLKSAFMTGTNSPSPDAITCNVIKYNNLTYWAYSYIDNRFSFGLVAYDTSNNVVKQWELAGARYLWKITLDPTAETVTFYGQGSQNVTKKWSDIVVNK